MTSLKLYLLGAPRAELDGEPIEVDTRKAIALLAYLALASPPGPRRRDSLAAFFWPDVDQARAHGALRRTLSALNKGLGGGWLRVERETVGFEPDANAWLDMDAFHACLAGCRTHGHPATEVCPNCLPALAQAAGLYRGDFMAGFTLRDSPAFDDWQFFQMEAARRDLAGALERLARGYAAQGDLEQGIEHARRWLALDSLHEPAHRQLMLLYAWSGQRAAAVRQYRECVRVLEQELGVAPLDETTQLYAALKENRPPAPPAPLAPAPATRGAATPAQPAAAQAPAPPQRPLVGRQAEWSLLLARYAAARVDGGLVVIEGEAGIGKTRLAEAFLEQARGGGARAVIARCFEGELNLAYGPFVEGLRAAISAGGAVGGAAPDWLRNLPAHWVSEGARLLPELQGLRPDAPPPLPLEGPGAQSRFFEGLRQLLLAALEAAAVGSGAAAVGSATAAGLLLIDDAQWIDEASLDLLTYIVRRARGQPLLLLVTWRAEQVPAGHRLRALLAEAQRGGSGAALKLRRLSRAAVAELVAQTRAARPLDVDTLERLFQESEGLPFFVVEYLAALDQAGSEQAAWWSLPGSVRSLLQARLAGVDEAGWQLLSTAAVIGRSFDFDTLHTASGRGDDETVGGLEGLIAAGLVGEVGPVGAGTAGSSAGSDPSYDFSHAKLRALVYEETSQARRRLLHRRVAEALSTRGQRQSGTPAGANSPLGALAGLIAQHLQLAGREQAAADYFKLAGEHARGLAANAEALAHFRSALALGHPAAAALHESIGDLETLSGAYDAALKSYETAAALAPAEDLGRLEHRLGGVYQRRGDWELAESHFESALNDLATASGAARARLLADWSLTAHRRGDTARALGLAQQALELAEAAADHPALAQAHNILGVLASSQGDIAQARHHLQRSLELAERLGTPGMRAAALNNLALAYGGEGDYEPALRLAEQALALSVAQGDRHHEAALHNNLADLLQAMGRTQDARRHVTQSVKIYAEIGAEAGRLQPEIWKLAEW